MLKGKINEVFESIQGEGVYLGEKQIFVRFFGCNLKCKFCDTEQNNFIEYTPQELFTKIKEYGNGCHSISFTGGEPLLQKDFLKEALKLTSSVFLKNYLETNGVLYDALEEVIDYVHIVSMDLKLPSSTGAGDFWDAHRKFLKVASAKEVFLKVVVCLSSEEADLRRGLKLIKDVNPFSVLVLQPNSSESCAALWEKINVFKDICAEEEVTAFSIPQVHKLIGVK